MSVAIAPQDENVSLRNVLPLFSGLLVAMLLAALDQNAFATALPTIVGELHGVAQMLWVTTAYLLASTIMLPIYGKFGDIVDRKKLFIGAIAVFMAGSVVGVLAHTMPQLIVGRAIQGIGGGGLMTLTFAILSARLAPKIRQKYSAILMGVFGLSSVFGPLFGGWLTDTHHLWFMTTSWRWAFWLNIPLGLLAIAAAVVFLEPQALPEKRPRIDWKGIALLAVISTMLVLVSSWGGSTYGWTSWQILTMSGITMVMIGIFIAVERRAIEPFLPMSVFGYRDFTLVTFAGIALGIAMFGAIGYMPTYIQMVSGFGASESGLLLLPMMGGMMVVSTIQGQLIARVDNFKYKWSPPLGMAVMAIALFLLGSLKPETPWWHICVYLGIMGAGLGLSMQLLVTIAQNTFPVTLISTVTGVNQYFRQMGASLGVALVGTLFVSGLKRNLPGMSISGGGSGTLTPAAIHAMPPQVREAIIAAYAHALTPVFKLMLPLVALAAIAMLFLSGKPFRQSNREAAAVECMEIGGSDVVESSADETDPIESRLIGHVHKAARNQGSPVRWYW